MLILTGLPSPSIPIKLVSPPYIPQPCSFDENSFDETRLLGTSPPKSISTISTENVDIPPSIVQKFHETVDKILKTKNLINLQNEISKLGPLTLKPGQFRRGLARRGLLTLYPGLINTLDPTSQKTALMKAAEEGNRFAVGLLLSIGARNRIKDEAGKTIGHTAFCHSLKFYRNGISLQILNYSHDATCCEKLPERAWNTITWSETPNYQLLSIFEKYSRKQFRPNFVNFASRDCRSDVMGHFISGGEKIENLAFDPTYSSSETPREYLGRRFLLAASCGDQNMVTLFLDNYPKIGNSKLIDYADENGATALHYASAEGHDALCQLLISRGANTKARTNVKSQSLPLNARNATYDVYGVTIQMNKQLIFALDCIHSDPQALMKLSQTIKDNMKSLEKVKASKTLARSVAASEDDRIR